MGATPWGYFTPYRQDVSAAFNALRRSVLGREGEERFLKLLEGEKDSPECERELMHMGEETDAILNMMYISDTPGICAITPLAPAKLLEIYGTDKPSHDQVENTGELYEMERGEGVYVIVYEGSVPKEIYFGGYTFD
ncbi:MAG TPA: hypothetical protein VFE47_13940 [Tepidisphaeraceae bacterium]|jgi:hypothetical protein|nr:hypothetical protein [Tepidisphaeraceae bacterium]